jgi:hypothetical protein
LFNLLGSSFYYVQQVICSFGVGLNSIQLKFSNGVTSYLSSTYGTYSGSAATFAVPTGQYISSIILCFGTTHIYSIQFTTNQGTQSSIYGTPLTSQAGTPACFNVNLPGGLLGFNLYASTYIYGLKFVSNRPVTYTNIPRSASFTFSTSLFFYSKFKLKIILIILIVNLFFSKFCLFGLFYGFNW